jgi:hypothetical protein
MVSIREPPSEEAAAAAAAGPAVRVDDPTT